MYKRVVVPLDGSTTALQVLPYAALISKASGAKIELLQALNDYPRELVREVSHEYVDGTVVYPPSQDAWANIQEQVSKDAKARLEGVAAPLRDDGLTVECHVVAKDPADAIIELADADPDTMIAISTHGRSGVGRWMLGSVTDQIVRRATHPTLVVRAREGEVTSGAPQLKQVILPLDGSDMSATAMPHAVEMAKALGLGITLMRSISPMSYGDTFADYVPSMYEDLTAEIELDVRDFLAREAGEVRKLGVDKVTERAVDGHAASAIIDEVGEDGDSLVVMATHGRSGVGRWVLGSVTDRVVRHSSGPVLVVRPSDHE